MKHLIIDTDPGIDDVLALMFTLRNPEVNVLGITTVSGNVTVDVATPNALRTLELLERTDIPVARGASLPLSRDQVTAEWVHGKDGIANLNLPVPSLKPVRQSAVEWMSETLRNAEVPVTVVALGPLTNLGLLRIQDPEAFGKIEGIVFMGGAAACPGNTTPRAEFNIYADPDAAKLVLSSGVPLTMVGLDVTMKTILREDHIKVLEICRGSAAAQFAAKLCRAAMNGIIRRLELKGIALHDPLAVGAAVDPSIVTAPEYHVEVETRGELTLGETIVDFRPWSDAKPNAKVALEVDADKFIKWFLKTLCAPLDFTWLSAT